MDLKGLQRRMRLSCPIVLEMGNVTWLRPQVAVSGDSTNTRHHSGMFLCTDKQLGALC